MALWRNAWREVGQRLGLPDRLVASEEQRIDRAYSEPQRFYHTLPHLDFCISHWASLREKFDDPDTALLALLYHDIVYEPARRDNEKRSAEQLATSLSNHLEDAVVLKAQEMIEATAKHAATGDQDTNLLLDIDMGILAAREADYDHYTEGVRKEFEPAFGRQLYLTGRLSIFLEPVLAQPRIFVSSLVVFDEAVARANLMNERQRLQQELAAMN